MLTLIIVSVGVASVFDAYTSFVTTNTWSTHSATGTFLASEIRELTRRLPKHDSVTGLEVVGGDLVGWGPEAGEFGPQDFDDLDDFNGLMFAYDGEPFGPGDLLTLGSRLPGPIDATGSTMDDFSLLGLNLDGEQTPFGWSQFVTVQKVDPFDFVTVLPNNFQVPPAGTDPGRAVDEYPLRVTVVVHYRDPLQDQPQVVAWLTWIVP
ncbi:MAG: hypothetical protein AAF108_08135 [Planctomycetota bacterium]